MVTRQHRGPEAFERFAHHRREVRRGAAKRPGLPAGRGQLLPGQRARRSATRWWSIRRRASSPSPARGKSACDINELAAKHAAGPDLDQARRRWRWAARTPSSWTPTPISMRPSRAWPRRRSASRARSARPARAPSSTRTIYDEFLEQAAKSAWQKITVGDPARTRLHGPGDQREAR